MRAHWAALVVVATGGLVRASAVAPPVFAAPEELSFFAPEVSRVVATVLDGAGVDVLPGGGLAVSGRIEALDGERIRLKATVAGQRPVQVEGLLEQIDQLAVQLGGDLVKVLPASARRAPGAASRTPPSTVVPVRQDKAPPMVAVASPASSSLPHSIGPAPGSSAPPSTPATVARPADPTPAPPSPTKANPSIAAVEPAAEPGRTEAARVDPPSPDPTTSAPVAIVTPPPVEKTAAVATAPERTTGVEEVVEAPKEKERRARPEREIVSPYDGTEHAPPRPPAVATYPTTAPLYIPMPAPLQLPQKGRPWTRPGLIGRAVLHAVNTPQGCRAGEWATLAARGILEGRLHVQAIPVGTCGYVSPSNAAAEAARYRVRSVVMLFFDQLNLEPGPGGFRAVGRLRVIVVHDGQQVLHRQLVLGPRPSQMPDVSRAAYDLVNDGLSSLAAELQVVLNDGR